MAEWKYVRKKAVNATPETYCHGDPHLFQFPSHFSRTS